MSRQLLGCRDVFFSRDRIDRAEKRRRVHDLKVWEALAENDALGRVLLHQISQGPMIPRHQGLCVARYCEIDERLVLLVAAKRKRLRGGSDMDRAPSKRGEPRC